MENILVFLAGATVFRIPAIFTHHLQLMGIVFF
jgi:hypothetical protein